jgi:hypothetical protein
MTRSKKNVVRPLHKPARVTFPGRTSVLQLRKGVSAYSKRNFLESKHYQFRALFALTPLKQRR